MQGLMIYENPVFRLGFATIMKREFGVEIDYTDRAAVLRAANALVTFDSVEDFLLDTGWDKDNPECSGEAYLVENKICRWVNGKFIYFSRLLWEKKQF